ncbi:MAG: pyridoxamine 5'-phosphate oxidase family protein [Proteobacteria bacterium]|nr:pyridoxamine 5'-phosphate oxidase family protein [Pseudomonadota bacterium]MDA1328881.1 pyridoxamine 5'-phosphate oxidase family protein [Pseudomonadota bacterium]
MRTPLQTPKEIREQIWRELARASRDHHHAWRTPVLATAGGDGFPNARVVVLREVDVTQQTLRVYTDSRSPKVKDLLCESRALFVFWSARLKWQLRASVAVSVETAGPAVQTRWQRVSQSASAVDYLSPVAPGDDVAESAQDAPPSVDAGHYFALLTAQIVEMDWLELNREGHRRASLTAGSWRWLAP